MNLSPITRDHVWKWDNLTFQGKKTQRVPNLETLGKGHGISEMEIAVRREDQDEGIEMPKNTEKKNKRVKVSQAWIRKSRLPQSTSAKYSLRCLLQMGIL